MSQIYRAVDKFFVGKIVKNNALVFKIALVFALFLGMFFLTFLASSNYPSNILGLYFFTFTYFLLIIFGFFKSHFYFIKFLTLFFTIGFWFKLIVHLVTNDFSFKEGIGEFIFNYASLNQLIIHISICSLTLLFVSILFNRILENFIINSNSISSVFISWYKKHRLILIFFWILILFFLGSLNLYFKIYQRGTISQVDSFIVRGFFAWALLFGFSSITSLFLFLDQHLNTKSISSHLVAYTESFLSSSSLLSRGFILNSGAFSFVSVVHWINSKQYKKIFIILILFTIFFYSSFKTSTLLRDFQFGAFNETQLENMKDLFLKNELNFLELPQKLVDRCVGLEGVMAGLSYSGNRTEAFKNIWNEKIKAGTSFYDTTIIKSIYSTSMAKNEEGLQLQFVTIPGILGWLSILDNLWISILGLASLTFTFGLLELLAKKLTSNEYFIALIGQVMAYRIAHFGFMPRQTYMLISTLAITILIMGYIHQKIIFKNNPTDN